MPLNNTQIGGGTFSGRAIYSDQVFVGMKEDVADLVTMISPAETPLLNLLGDAIRPAFNVYYEWQESELGPNAIINSIAIASTTVDTAFSVAGGLAAFLQKGMVLNGQDEYLQILSVADPTIVVSRAFAGTAATSFGTSQYLTVISDAATDGADVLVDTSRPRPRKGNYTQNFKKDIIISGTQMAVAQHGGVSDEFEYQKQLRLREALRDLEKATIMGRLSGNTIGSGSSTRTFRGLLQAIATNIVTSSIGTDFGSTTMALFEDRVNAMVKSAWLNGGTDLDVILCGDAVKKRFDQLNSSRIRVANDESTFRNQMVTYENTYGVFRVAMSRWMPTHKAAIIATPRVKVVPMNGRSFHFDPVAKTGDAEKGMILGEYTMEHKNENGMAQIVFSSLAPGAGELTLQAK